MIFDQSSRYQREENVILSGVGCTLMQIQNIFINLISVPSNELGKKDFLNIYIGSTNKKGRSQGSVSNLVLSSKQYYMTATAFSLSIGSVFADMGKS